MQDTSVKPSETESTGEDTGAPSQDAQGYLMLRGLIIPLSHEGEFVLGRDKSECSVVLAHEHISKQHAIISYRSGRYFIRDLGSLNGSYVNGERVNGMVPLVAGDEIRLPPYMMLFFGPEQQGPVNRAVRTSGLKSSASRKKGSISGLLNIISLTDLIQLLNFTTQSGVLTIRTPELEIAEITFAKGEIVQARYAGETGVLAVYNVLGTTSGEFEFIQGELPIPADRITQKTQSVLLEGSKLLDEGALSGSINTMVMQ
jgi:pSer/pThr/pTyr-binding forkhead associated (FHA) protein